MKNVLPLKFLTSSLCILVCLLAHSARADLLYWDNNGIANAGSGTWDLSTANWAPSSTLTSSTVPFTNGGFAVFTAGAALASATITVAEPITIAGLDNNGVSGNRITNLTINASGSGVLTLSGSDFTTTNQFYQDPSTTVTINCPINGGGLLSQNGVGALQLYGNNSYSGGTLETGGQVLYYNNANSFGTGPIYWTATGSLWNTGSPLTLTNDWYISTSGTINFAAGATTCSGHVNLLATPNLKNNGNNTTVLTISGPISGAFGLTLQCPNAGKIVLSGPNTYTGKTSVGLNAGANGTFVSVSSLNSVNGGTPLLASSSLGCPTNVPNGTIDLGYSTFTNVLIYTGGGETSDRVINLASTTGNQAIQADGSGSLVFTSDFTATGAGSKSLLLQGSSTAANAVNGKIVDNTSANKTSLIKNGTTKWVLGGANTYSGNTTVNVGTLALGVANAIPSGSGKGTLTVASSGTFDLAGNDCTVNAANSAGTIDCTSGTATLTLSGAAAALTYSGPIQNSGSGTLNLVYTGTGTGTSPASFNYNATPANTYSGKTTVKNAILQIQAESNLGATPSSLVSDSITLDQNLAFNTATVTNVNNYYLRLQTTTTVDLNANRGIYLGNSLGYGGGLGAQSGKTLNVRGPITGPGGLWLGGGTVDAAVGNVVLFNTGNTYSGGTHITGGTLTLGDNNVLPSGTSLSMVDLKNPCNFDMNGKSQTIGPLSGYTPGTPQIKLTGALTIIQSANTSFGGVISQSGGSLTLDATSTGTLTLTNNNTYTGPTAVNGGRLEIAASGSLVSPVTVASGAALKLDATTALTTAANLILNAGASVDLNFSGTSAIHYLSLDGGATFVQPGTYGPVGSTATFTDARFTSSAGNGILSVLGAPTVAVVSSLNPSTYGDSVTFTATVTGSGATPSGTITFKDGATAMGTVTLDGAGHAAFPTNGLGAATHSITAAYSGDVNYGSATSTAISQVVNPAASSTLLVASQNPSTNGVSVTFTATVTGAGTPTGNVVLRTNGVAMATVALTAGTASAATADLPIGTNTVTAEYATQANWLGSTNSLSQVVYSAVTLSTTNAIVSIVNNNNGTFTVNAVGTPGAQYYLASTSDLTVAMSSWTPLAGSTNTAPLPNGLWSFAVSNAAPAFYHSVAIHPAP